MLRPARVRHVTVAIRNASTARSVRFAKANAAPEPAQSVIPQKTPPPTFARSRALPWVFASIFAFGIAFYGSALVVAASKSCNNPEVAYISKQKDVSGRYNETADSFDSEVGFSEILMGVNGIRKKLAKECTGHVLEVSCGTGRNLGYYDIGKDSGIQSLTLVDLSPRMIDVCKKKWNVLYGGTLGSDTYKAHKNFKPGLIVRFLTASALQSMPPTPDNKKYDTVIQTMGLCSTPSPEALLLNMTNHLDMLKPESRILLLEHGRSYREWLNNILDGAAEKHAEIHGCWFNRDIGAIVEDAAQKTGLKVVSEKRHHFGTTWVFELRPDPELVERIAATREAASEQAQVQPQNGGWRSWLGLG